MRIGLPKEVKDNEYRVAMTPGVVRQMVESGHKVQVESNAGEGSGFSDKEYEEAGADLVSGSDGAWDTDLVIKVKEPQPSEYHFLRPGLTLFTFLHLAAEKELTLEMVNVRTGDYDKQSAKISKGYHESRAGKFWHYNSLKGEG